MEELKEVYLRKCQDFACQPIAPLVDELSAGYALAALDLKGSNKRLFSSRVTPVQVFALCEALYEDTNIVSIDLSYNFLDDMAAQAVAGLIKANSTLSFINLAGNDITHQGAAHLAKALASPGVTLQALVLNGNPLGDAGVESFGDMLRDNSSLKALDLSNVRAGVKGIISICSALAEANTALEVLDLGAPDIHMTQDTTILNLARMLASNSTLMELGLSKHNMVDSQFETLVTYGLLRNSALTTMDLRANRLSPFSGPQIERLLAENHRLVSLNLSHNQLGNDGALSIARSLPYTHWLQQLDLRSNNIGEQGLVALAEALALASHLQVLMLWGNKFGPASCRALHDTLTQTTGLSMLITDIKPYEVDGVAQVALLQESGA